MSQYSSGAGLVLPADRGLYSLVDDGARTRPEHAVLARQDGTAWRDVTYRQLDAHVRDVAAVLLADGVATGERVGIFGRTSYEWVVADLAVLAIGAISVPIFPTASEQQIRHIVSDSGMSRCFVETPAEGEMITGAGTSLRSAPWPFDALESWRGAGSAAETAAAFEPRRAAVHADALATIVYTSGTTGMPKGCMLTHGNLFASSVNTVEHTGELFRTRLTHGAPPQTSDQPGEPEQAATLLCLPLAHVFGRTILVACLYAGTRTGLLPGVADVLPAMSTFRPTVLALVPFALEKIRKGLRRTGDRGVVDQATERAAVAAGLARVGGAPADGAPADVSPDSAAAFARIHGVFGGRLTHVISGGASLDDTTAAFYRGIGVEILNCYGLTEAATAVTVNRPDTNRVGTVGQPIPGTTVAIAPDDEVLVAGPNVSPGYWPPSETGAGSDGDAGWLHTGDLGRLDDDGFLVITGRRKEILVTSGGKNVTPTLLEDRMRLHPLVSNSMVVGEAKPYVAALVTLEPDVLATLASTRGIDLAAPGWWEHPELTAAVLDAVNDANSLVSRAESIRRFRILPTQFTIDSGQLTPSMKLRRARIETDFAAEIDELYTPGSNAPSTAERESTARPIPA